MPNSIPPQERANTARKFLRSAARLVEEHPQTNSVFTFASGEFAKLENGDIHVSDLEDVIDHIHSTLTHERADLFREQHFEAGKSDQWSGAIAAMEALADLGWEDFKANVESPKGGIVFTAHPTFARSRKMREAFADYVEAKDDNSSSKLTSAISEDCRDWSKSISLQGEHDEIQHAIEMVQLAMREYSHRLVDVAKKRFPENWLHLNPALPTVASWVGYDLDGRTDIDWWQSVALRLSEKSIQLKRYADRLRQTGVKHPDCEALIARMEQAAELSKTESEAFQNDLNNSDNLFAAAECLSAENPVRILKSSTIADALTSLMELPGLSEVEVQALWVLRTEVEALKLGTARIHLRVNAAQVRGVIYRDLDLDTENRDLGRLALQKLSAKAHEPPSREVNFAELFLEKSTAQRQFMMCALWLKYIDAESPIRFLIAEAENPATVMGALFLARQYGIESSLDISPLFETPEALESGGRFISRLLEEESFQAYLKKRGYLSIQLGFSDAGRFIGQVSADMAIERLHSLVIRALSESTEDIGLLVFNTHGESFGRGAYPGSFTQRFDHALTPWIRSLAIEQDVSIQHEVSFQGGDGVLHFLNPAVASATYAHWCSHHLSAPEQETADPFYGETDFVWDLYRSLREWHERLFNNEDYARLLSDFATNFLVRAGSRQRRRATGPKGPRSLRAISHNATLQQLGIPINSAGGFGSAIRRETERLESLIGRSKRMHHLLGLAQRARMLTSIPTLRAYASVYDPSFWVAISRYGSADRAPLYRRVYYALQEAETFQSLNRMANQFSVDLAKFDNIIGVMDDVPSTEDRYEERLDLHVLHGIRQSLMMFALSTIAQLPRISGRHDISLGDIMQMILEMKIAQAAEKIQEVFPRSSENVEKLAAMLDSSQTGFEHGYDQIYNQIVLPLENIDRALHKSTLAIAEAYGAYG